MNDIQKDYLIGLTLKKLKKYDLASIKEVNVNNDSYVENIERFIEKYGKDLSIIEKIYHFIKSDEQLLQENDINIEKIGLYNSIKTSDYYFTISQVDFISILEVIQCYMKDYLPLGSVVKLNKEKLNIESSKDLIVVIEQRMIHPKGKQYYIDYRAIPYPMGIFNEQMYVYFSSEDIEEIIFSGYSDPENEGYELALKESLIDNDILSISYQKDFDEEKSY
ncbi:hypothetical protein OKW23_000340 [Bacilli bacterium PM5-9]|nr:hypothetical protein [Bacilli bacterium PM5-9]